MQRRTSSSQNPRSKECVRERKKLPLNSQDALLALIYRFPAELTENTNPSKRAVVPAKVVYRKGHTCHKFAIS